MAAIGRKYDVAERDARNRAVGKAGEECVLHHERRHLSAAGRDDLADKVRWTSVQDGDGFGFDIRSFEADGREKLIEVKTTNGWERTPFHISRNELAVADPRSEAHTSDLQSLMRISYAVFCLKKHRQSTLTRQHL